MNDKLKQIIFKKLYRDLSHVEIICHTDGSIWFIDREEKYWYLEFKKSGELWWRWQFFSIFFQLFSLEQSEYEPLMMEWVEEILNRKVVSSFNPSIASGVKVEEILNRKVVSSLPEIWHLEQGVEEILNRKVVSSVFSFGIFQVTVEDVLNRKVVSSLADQSPNAYEVEYVLNRKVVSSTGVYGS